jgi:hypothetical protein
MKQKGLKLQSMTERASLTDKILLGIILLTGIVLRFYNHAHIPFVHDEISTLFRAYYNSYSSLGELVRNALKSDVHPPGLVIFVHYWAQLVGDSPQAIKLPFIIAGILSILLAYKIASQWFNQTTALLTAAGLSTNEYIINYSIIARPYAFGMFFALLIVYCQWNFFQKEKQKNSWLAGFILSGIACIYLHYFSLLFAFIASVIGFFICPKEKLRQYFLSLVIIALSFLPFVPILLAHLHERVTEQTWIGKPTLGFVARYFFYVCHYSWWLFAAIVIVIAALYFKRSWANSDGWTKRKWIAFSLFVVPFVIGFLVSQIALPVLEFSGLIFGFVFLPMFLFSSGKELNSKLKTLAVLGLLVVSTLTLTIERKHFELFYNQGIEKLNTEIQSNRQLLGNALTIYFVNVEKYFEGYYSKRLSDTSDVKLISLINSADVNQLSKQLSEINATNIAFGTVTTFPVEVLSVIQKQYPYLVKKYNGLLTEFYLYSKEKPAVPVEDLIFSSANSSLSAATGTTVLFAIPLKSIMKNYSDIVTTSMNVYIDELDTLSNLELITEYNGKALDKKSVKLADYASQGKWSEVDLSVRLTDISIRFKTADLKIVINNRTNAPIKIADAKLTVQKGNPYLYGQSFH